ncbi:MAG TPA: hypothetical protein VGM96_00340, partial [Reyranella sp.]
MVRSVIGPNYGPADRRSAAPRRRPFDLNRDETLRQRLACGETPEKHARLNFMRVVSFLNDPLLGCTPEVREVQGETGCIVNGVVCGSSPGSGVAGAEPSGRAAPATPGC